MKYFVVFMLLTAAAHACVTGPNRDGKYTIDPSGSVE